MRGTAFAFAFTILTTTLPIVACGLDVVGGADADEPIANDQPPQGSGTAVTPGLPGVPSSKDDASIVGTTPTNDGSVVVTPNDSSTPTPTPDSSSPVVDAAIDTTAPTTPCAACPSNAAQTLCVANACVPTRRVFVSSTASTANLGGVTGADARCQTLATAANLGGAWRAWVSSDQSSVSSRFSKPAVPYRLLNGTTIATSYANLTSGSIAHGIDRDENGIVTLATEVWTATTPSGNHAGGGCTGFTSANNGAPNAAQGISDRTNGQWTNVYVQFCDRTNPRIYCFEQ